VDAARRLKLRSRWSATTHPIRDEIELEIKPA